MSTIPAAVALKAVASSSDLGFKNSSWVLAACFIVSSVIWFGKTIAPEFFFNCSYKALGISFMPKFLSFSFSVKSSVFLDPIPKDPSGTVFVD